MRFRTSFEARPLALLGVLTLAVLLGAPVVSGQGLRQEPGPALEGVGPRGMGGGRSAGPRAEAPGADRFQRSEGRGENSLRPAALLSWEGVLDQVQKADRRARQTPILVEGNLTLNADGSITITSLSGTARFGQANWNAEENPLARILGWQDDRFHLRLGPHTTIVIRGTNLPGLTAAEGWGLAIRANLTYEGVGAFVVQVASGAERRGILVEGEAKRAQPDGQVLPTGRPVSVLAARARDGLGFITNGRIAVRGEGVPSAHFRATVQGFLYAQGYRDAGGRPRGIDVVGGTVQGMAVGSRVALGAPQEGGGQVTNQVVINGALAALTIPPQLPGGRPVYLSTLSYTPAKP